MSGHSTVRYKIVPGFPAYRVGSDGSVWSNFNRPANKKGNGTWQRLKPHWCGRGRTHLAVKLSRGKEKHGRYVHQLVLLAFVGSRPKGMQACHNDGNAENNAVENLRWDTPKSNAQDAIRHGTFRTIHSRSAIKKAKKLYFGGMRQVDVAEVIGMSQAYVSSVVRGLSRKEVV